MRNIAANVKVCFPRCAPVLPHFHVLPFITAGSSQWVEKQSFLPPGHISTRVAFARALHKKPTVDRSSGRTAVRNNSNISSQPVVGVKATGQRGARV